MRFIYNPDKKHISLPGVLYALGDPVRLEIVRLLAMIYVFYLGCI